MLRAIKGTLAALAGFLRLFFPPFLGTVDGTQPRVHSGELRTADILYIQGFQTLSLLLGAVTSQLTPKHLDFLKKESVGCWVGIVSVCLSMLCVYLWDLSVCVVCVCLWCGVCMWYVCVCLWGEICVVCVCGIVCVCGMFVVCVVYACVCCLCMLYCVYMPMNTRFPELLYQR